MRTALRITLIIFLLYPQEMHAQLSGQLDGYASNMQSVMFEKADGQWISDNLIHNRINTFLYLGQHVELTAQYRNRMMYGETVKYFPGYPSMIGADPGWQDLSWNLVEDSSWLLNSSLDRLYADISLGKLQVTVGRQRINWGQNFVWNPNDIFNTYSFFDFDYVERPGSDAVRTQLYFSSTASWELAAKLNSRDQWSAATLFRFNFKGYDIQLLTGFLNEEEYVVGGGFSGYLGPVSLTGEITYLDPWDDNNTLETVWLAGAGISYNTPFNLFIQVEYLYNQAAENQTLSGFQDFYYRNMTIRDLSFAPHSFFVNLSYPATPLLNLGFSSMMMTGTDGLYLGPTVDVSLRQDLDLSFIVQHFQMSFESGKQKYSLGFLRLKWSF